MQRHQVASHAQRQPHAKSAEEEKKNVAVEQPLVGIIRLHRRGQLGIVNQFLLLRYCFVLFHDEPTFFPDCAGKRRSALRTYT